MNESTFNDLRLSSLECRLVVCFGTSLLPHAPESMKIELQVCEGGWNLVERSTEIDNWSNESSKHGDKKRILD